MLLYQNFLDVPNILCQNALKGIAYMAHQDRTFGKTGYRNPDMVSKTAMTKSIQKTKLYI